MKLACMGKKRKSIKNQQKGEFVGKFLGKKQMQMNMEWEKMRNNKDYGVWTRFFKIKGHKEWERIFREKNKWRFFANKNSFFRKQKRFKVETFCCSFEKHNLRCFEWKLKVGTLLLGCGKVAKLSRNFSVNEWSSSVFGKKMRVYLQILRNETPI